MPAEGERRGGMHGGTTTGAGAPAPAPGAMAKEVSLAEKRERDRAKRAEWGARRAEREQQVRMRAGEKKSGFSACVLWACAPGGSVAVCLSARLLAPSVGRVGHLHTHLQPPAAVLAAAAPAAAPTPLPPPPPPKKTHPTN